MMTNKPLWLFVAWLTALVLLFVPPTNPPGASPVRVKEAYPVHYAAPALSYDEFPWAPLPEDDPTAGFCPVARAAVIEQGIGE